jgi:hypothetical protein
MEVMEVMNVEGLLGSGLLARRRQSTRSVRPPSPTS